MKAFINIQKRVGTSVCKRNGALLDAVRSNVLDWEVATEKTLEHLGLKRQLKRLLGLAVTELNDNPHDSFAELEARGVFGFLAVYERKGCWRVECDNLGIE